MAEVKQDDREAAADFLESWDPGPEMTVVKLAKAFTAHREAAEKAERERIAAWLETMNASEWNQIMDGKSHLPWALGLATAIRARGDGGAE